MIELRRNNVVKIVDSEERAKRLEAEGYRRAGYDEDTPVPKDKADEFAAAVQAEVDRIVAQMPTQADFEAAVAAEVERRLAEKAAGEDVNVLRSDAEEPAAKMGVAPDKKGEKAEKSK